jgi:ubiquinone/menaquinone biosynthesis C-methylase UbiE
MVKATIYQSPPLVLSNGYCWERLPLSNPKTLLPLLYAMDEHNGWSQGMRAITHALLAPHHAGYRDVLEVGCGAGAFLYEWASTHTQAQMIGADLHPLAMGHANQQSTSAPAGAVDFIQSDLHHLPFADATFDLVIALDAFDQQGITLAHALRESHRVLRNAGELLLRVSAYPWLMSTHDIAFNTARRFNRRQLLALLHEFSFTPLRVTHANSLLALPIIGLRLLQRWMVLPHRAELYQDSLSHQLLAAALQWEAHWLRHHNLLGGISLYVLARKAP